MLLRPNEEGGSNGDNKQSDEVDFISILRRVNSAQQDAGASRAVRECFGTSKEGAVVPQDTIHRVKYDYTRNCLQRATPGQGDHKSPAPHHDGGSKASVGVALTRGLEHVFDIDDRSGQKTPQLFVDTGEDMIGDV